MTKIVIVSVALLAASMGPGVVETPNAAGVTGTWDLVVKGPAAHGDMTATLELQQDGRQYSER